MNNLKDIENFIRSTIYPKNVNFQREEILAYVFVTKFVDRYQQEILTRLRNLLTKIIKIMDSYYKNFEHEENSNVRNVAIAKGFDCGKCKNTGAVKPEYENIIGITKDGNIREIFFLFDEFVHKCCFIMSWLLYCHTINQIVQEYGLSETDIIKKLKFVAEVISGSKQKKFDDTKYLENFIRKFLGEKYKKYSGKGKTYTNYYPWQILETPSICNLWDIQEKEYTAHKLLYTIEYPRYIDMPKQLKPYFIEMGDPSKFDPPNICFESSGTFKHVPTLDQIKLPPLSDREISFLKINNREIEINRKINWKGGCCYYYPKDETVSYKISTDKIKPRMTSYSGHNILEFELLSLLDPDFEDWKIVYLLCIMATMVPYCHHSAHEIFSTATYFGIDYDIDSNYYNNFLNAINSYKFPPSFDKDEIKKLLFLVTQQVNSLGIN
ncbi:MAG: hypothetical protein Satyrvirus1_56 [Satyrvirus sp.]|uniref:Uncharacterized protein n=1 Tax=Satyrvirus sp. TaxID=2487771 RepID=A0A3G5ACS3_9VIRU|nr:MAG: hypothetical protein Satyrvirus1_56 [Satyrvirus sp.]